jgi:hypothetical protein
MRFADDIFGVDDVQCSVASGKIGLGRRLFFYNSHG